ncbi:L,D-transpeptidase family protein [Cellulosilyticum ruminicola]|uniref:L,D-transpeptidase family protein n=1 Tax=Cellulosilyticum ruminicola TaxID=425254 RepID=UPI0006D08714|nr:Ig-like domain-containing protein [Cellulosilyticum ruminicola]
MKKKQLNIFAFTITSIIIFLWCTKSLCLNWVEVNEKYAEVTVNFLLPMQQQDIDKNIYIESEFESENKFDYTYEWLSKCVLLLKIKENNQIRGQKVKLYIKDAPSIHTWLKKTVHIPVQFKAPVEILSPTEELLIASNNSFVVTFNTPMNLNKISKYIQCEKKFNIIPAERPNKAGKKSIDATRFIFTPCEPLENNTIYKVVFKKGMPSRSGSFLEKAQYVTLKTDEKPEIISTYPKDQDKWIGLYPRITITTDRPIVKAMLQLEGQLIEGKLSDNYHATFVLKEMLTPDTTYDAKIQVQAASGEKSDIKHIAFTSTSIDKDRLWAEIIIGKPSELKIYKGTKLIRQMNCSIGADKYEPVVGNYYILDKQPAYEDVSHEEGANYWLPISEQLGFQGVIRDDRWHIKNCIANTIGARTDRNNIILEENDAKWIYENIPIETMVIIRK